LVLQVLKVPKVKQVVWAASDIKDIKVLLEPQEVKVLQV